MRRFGGWKYGRIIPTTGFIAHRAWEAQMDDRKNVLVIDDDPDILEQVNSILSPYYNVKTGCSGTECLDLAQASIPDAILLDVIMSHLGDGLDCLQKLKEEQATKHIPIIIMTSVNDVYDYRTQVEASFYAHDRWLDKPVKAEVLLQTVHDVLAD
jgi:putative two-component system response regulator